MIQSLMQDVPLTLHMVLERVERFYREKRIVTRFGQGLHEESYALYAERVARLACGLHRLGIRPGDHVATLAWNSHRHLELYMAVPCMGAVLHTINARLAADDIAALLEHAGDSVLFVDRSLVPVVARMRRPTALRHIVRMPDDDMACPETDDCLDYEDLLAQGEPSFRWPRLDERHASGICYTSGSTGRPKGVVYSHRSTTLHTMALLFADGIGMREADVCMPVVPMFHANGWGFPYAALMAGASLALPARHLDPPSLVDLIAAARVTMATAVPTVWINFLAAIRSGQIAPDRIASLERVPIGGAAVPRSLIEGLAEHGIRAIHCWGMTEVSPLGLVGVPRSTYTAQRAAEARLTSGLPVPGCSLRIVSETGGLLPADGSARGELHISSPWAAGSYYDPARPENRRDGEAFVDDPDGRRWLRTGDIATITSDGYVTIVDRAKDLIKSGGEWISSQMIENTLRDLPDVKDAAVVPRPDPVWQERPVAFVVLGGGATSGEDTLRSALLSRLPKWQVPDDIFVVPDLPRGPTGKVDKLRLRTKVNAEAGDGPTRQPAV